MNNYSYLSDSSFLKNFNLEKIKEQYVKITVLDFFEKPIQSIEGKVTGGSFTISGDSSMRRTGNVSLVADKEGNDLTNVNSLLSINKKIKVEIGFKNTTSLYSEYKIIWFPMGVYVIMNPSITSNTQSCSISLQLHDKMCLLNGECGGVIPASTTLHEYETIDENGNPLITKPTIYQIILELVNHFGGEQIGKILINDLDSRVKQVVKWVGNTPLYYTERENTQANEFTYNFYTNRVDAVKEESGFKNVTNLTYTYGDDVGYIYTDFTYPGELIADAGSSVVTQLDTIKNALGNFEYFYDLDGNFVFQEKKNYLNTSQATDILNHFSKGNLVEIDRSKQKAVYNFDNSNIITSYTNSPQFNMIKNHFIVWGIRETAAGAKLPIRYELAIDKKPDFGKRKYSFYYYLDTDTNTYQVKPMEHYAIEDMKVDAQYEPIKTEEASEYVRKNYEFGKLYAAEKKVDGVMTYIVFHKVYDDSTKKYGMSCFKDDGTAAAIFVTGRRAESWREELFLQGVEADRLAVDSNYYYTALKNEFPKIFDYTKANNGDYDYIKNIDVTSLDYFLDIIDQNSGMEDISVNSIGRRIKVVNDDKINCIFEPEIPNYIIIESDSGNVEETIKESQSKGEPYIVVNSNIYNMLAIGGNFNSAYNKAQELLYQYTSYNNTISLTALPMYYLEPNTRISVQDANSGIYGDYIINSITIPLDIGGTMTLSCSRAMEQM